MTHYTFTIQATVDGVTAPLQIHAETMNEMRNALTLLRQYEFLAETQAENGNGNAPVCHVHKTKMKPSQYGGYFCPVKDASGSYCKVKQS
jgi:hypothetical protein